MDGPDAIAPATRHVSRISITPVKGSVIWALRNRRIGTRDHTVRPWAPVAVLAARPSSAYGEGELCDPKECQSDCCCSGSGEGLAREDAGE